MFSFERQTLIWGRGVQHKFQVWGRATGKGYRFSQFWYKEQNGINFYDFGMRNGIDFANWVYRTNKYAFFANLVQGQVYLFATVV